MFTRYRTQGIIFDKKDSGEADRIFTVFTKDYGKLDFLAKSERKITSKLRAGLEIFYLSEVEFVQGKAYKTLTDAILINNFKNLRKSLIRLKIAYGISEILKALIKHQEHDSKVWLLISESFEKLNNPKIKNFNLKIILYYFLWNFLLISGYELEIYNCVVCGEKIKPNNIFFSPKEGGLLCQGCAKNLKSAKEINPNVVKIIRILIKRDWFTLGKLKIDKEHLNQLSEVSRYYFSQILE